MELFTQYSGEPSLFASHTQENTRGPKKDGSGSLALKNKANYLLEEVQAIAGDVAELTSIKDQKLEALKAMLKCDESEASDILDNLKLSEIELLKDATFRLFCMCRDKMNGK